MGYETRMYIGRPYYGGEEPYVQIEGHRSAYRVYDDKKDKKGAYFYIDGETKRYVSGLKRTGKKYKIVKVTTMQVIAMVDLCKASCGAMQDVIDSGHDGDENRGGIYDSGGNNIIVEDCYGSSMTFVDPKEVLAAMQEEQNKEEYRRFTIAIPALEGAINGFAREDLRVLFFGY